VTEIAFRPLARDDLRTVHEWLQRPHVREWWGPRDTYEEVEERYLPRIEGREPVRMFFILLDERSIGVIQTYRIDDYPEYWPGEAKAAQAGLDLYIAEPELLGRGLGPKIIRRFADEVVFTDPSITACIADPELANTRSVRAFEKAGFQAVGEFDRAGDRPRVLVRLGRVVD
jgi:RimJ/RimL family protein N-acetyltransferase